MFQNKLFMFQLIVLLPPVEKNTKLEKKTKMKKQRPKAKGPLEDLDKV